MTWLNPTPAFPAYSGPYKVGSLNVEIPASELESPEPTPSSDTTLPTVAFRIFYPCQPHSKEKYVRWIPSPQREYIGAYARFLGASNVLSQFFALVPQLLYYISIPAHHNAEILEPPEGSKKWPVMIFSHGLGGSRNAYSHIVGSLASHGIVVIAPDHRDGSSPISFVHTPDGVESVKPVEYKRVPHHASTEVYEARDEQLRIRLWELGLIHDALLKIDKRIAISNVADDHKKHKGLTMFAHRLAVQEPGSISFAGHSFGAATMVQFIKSTFYRSGSEDPNYSPLFAPSDSSSIVRQITPASSVILLDMWTLPIQSPATTWLRRQAMPCYSSREGGSNLLAILSEGFYKWSTNLNETKQIVAKSTSSEDMNKKQPGPHIFYPIASAHLSQSDFGILFPWLTNQMLGAKDPERVLKLNTRAILQLLRNNNIKVAGTSAEDLELTESTESQSHDEKILSKTKDSIRGWVNLGTDPEARISTKVTKSPIKAVVEGEVLGELMKDQGR